MGCWCFWDAFQTTTNWCKCLLVQLGLSGVDSQVCTSVTPPNFGNTSWRTLTPQTPQVLTVTKVIVNALFFPLLCCWYYNVSCRKYRQFYKLAIFRMVTVDFGACSTLQFFFSSFFLSKFLYPNCTWSLCASKMSFCWVSCHEACGGNYGRLMWVNLGTGSVLRPVCSGHACNLKTCFATA